jgi:hypothetical protein
MSVEKECLSKNRGKSKQEIMHTNPSELQISIGEYFIIHLSNKELHRIFYLENALKTQ